MSRSLRPSEEIREKLRQKVTEDGRGYDVIAELVGIKGPTLHRFLNTPGAGSEALPKLRQLFNFGFEAVMELDPEERELLNAFHKARAQGRNGRALVRAFKDMTGVEENPLAADPGKTRGPGDV